MLDQASSQVRIQNSIDFFGEEGVCPIWSRRDRRNAGLQSYLKGQGLAMPEIRFGLRKFVLVFQENIL